MSRYTKADALMSAVKLDSLYADRGEDEMKTARPQVSYPKPYLHWRKPGSLARWLASCPERQ